METSECRICFCELEDPVLLSCFHKFCSNCFNQFINSKIKDQNPTDLQCPDQGCSNKLHVFELELLLPKLMFQQLCMLMLNRNFIMDLSENEILMDCINDKCSSKLCLWREADYYKCPQCKNSYCLLCRGFLHKEQKLTCKEAQGLNAEEQERLRTYKDQGFQKCPHCNNAVEKINGCNFITCGSQVCLKQKYFCYLCGEKLLVSNHYNHWTKNDPFKGDCRVQNEKGEWVDKSELEKLKIKPQENEHPCPGCQTKDPKLCEISPNFLKNVAECASPACKNSNYCMTCKKKFEMNLIDQHFDIDQNWKCRNPQQN